MVQLPVPVRVHPVADLRSRGRFDRGGRVVAGVVPGGREPADIAAVADQVRGDDRTGAVHIGDAGPGHRDCIRDALLELREVTIDASDFGQELERLAAPLGPDRVHGPDPAQFLDGAGCGQPPGKAAGDEMTQHRVQPTDRPGSLRDQLVVALGQQAQHRGVWSSTCTIRNLEWRNATIAAERAS